MRIPILLAFVALVLSGCNADQAINPSGQANRCANDPSCIPTIPPATRRTTSESADRSLYIAMDEPVDLPPSPLISRRRRAWGRSTSPAPIIPIGSTMRAPSSTSTGARAPISPSSSTPPGPTSARPTIHERFGIPAESACEFRKLKMKRELR